MSNVSQPMSGALRSSRVNRSGRHLNRAPHHWIATKASASWSTIMLLLTHCFCAAAEIQFQSQSPPLELENVGFHPASADGFVYVPTISGLTVCDIRDRAHPLVKTNIHSLPPPTATFPFSVHLAGRRLYVPGFPTIDGGRTNNIGIFEVEAPGQIKRVGGAFIDAVPTFCTTRGDFLVASGTTNGVYILNVADPTSPMLVAHITGIDRSLALGILDNLAYVTSYDLGLRILDISQADDPRVVFPGIPGARQSFDLSISENRLALATDFGWALYELSDRLQPRFLSTNRSYEFINRVSLHGSQLFTTDPHGFTAFGIENPEKPQFAGRFAPKLPVENGSTSFYQYVGMTSTEDQIAVTYDRWLMLFQIQPATTAPVASLPVTDQGNTAPHAVLDAKTLLVSGPLSSGGVQFVSMENPLQPKIVGGWSTSVGSQGTLTSLASVSGRIFGLNRFRYLVELEQTSPTNAEVLNIRQSTHLAMGSSADRIALADTLGVTVLQFPVSGPPNQGRTSLFGGCNPGTSRPLSIDGGWVFADRALIGECPTNELVALDFADLSQPAVVASARVDQRIAYVHSAKDIVYAGLADGVVKVYRFKDRGLAPVGEFRGLGAAVSGLYANGVLYWGLVSGGFQIFDVRDPTNIRPLGGYAGVEAPTFSSDGKWLRVVSSRGDLKVFPLVEFQTLELEARRKDSGSVLLEVRGRPGDTIEIQHLTPTGEWVAEKNLEIGTGFVSLDLGESSQGHDLFRAIRR